MSSTGKLWILLGTVLTYFVVGLKTGWSLARADASLPALAEPDRARA